MERNVQTSGGKAIGVKRKGPAPRFAPIRVSRTEEVKRPIAFFEDVHVKEGTTNDRLRPRRDPAGDQHLHHPEASGGRAAHPVKRTYRAWTDDEDTQIKVMYKHGYTVRQIAEELDRTWQSTNKRLIRLREKDPSIPFSMRKGRPRS